MKDEQEKCKRGKRSITEEETKEEKKKKKLEWWWKGNRMDKWRAYGKCRREKQIHNRGRGKGRINSGKKLAWR